MSPDMLTLVAAVLAYDRALETCERKSSFSEFRYAMSETSVEKDMIVGDLWLLVTSQRDGRGRKRYLEELESVVRTRGYLEVV